MRGGEPVVRHTVHPDLAVVVRDVLHEPVDAVVGIGGLVGGCGIGEVHLRRELEHAFGLEAPAQILNDEDVAVGGELLDIGRHLRGRAVGDAVRSAAKQNRERLVLADRSQDHRLQADAVAHRDHHFLHREDRLRTRRLCAGGGGG